jgi:nitrogen fixation/metabolism regulation signal transduction histidine kinase
MIKRKIIFVKKKVQLQIVLLSLLSFLFGASFAAYEAVALMEKIFASHPVLIETLFEEGYSVFLAFALKIAICSCILALLTTVLSNKFAGPLYRFEQVCRSVAKGNLKERVRLRDGDYMRDFQDEFNNMLDAVENEVKKAAPKGGQQ